jgi:hypothetical protein
VGRRARGAFAIERSLLVDRVGRGAKQGSPTELAPEKTPVTIPKCEPDHGPDHDPRGRACPVELHILNCRFGCSYVVKKVNSRSPGRLDRRGALEPVDAHAGQEAGGKCMERDGCGRGRWGTQLERHPAARCPGQRVNERTCLVKHGLNAAPLAHKRFQLGEPIEGLIACEIDHASAAGPDGFDLSSVLLNLPVARDDEPSLAGGLRDPDLVLRANIRDGAWCPDPATLYRPPGSPG